MTPPSPRPLTIWCNAAFPDPVMDRLRQSLGGHTLLLPTNLQASNLVPGGPDPLLEQADIALGQPDPGQVISLSRLLWVHLTSAGYTRYDTAAVRKALGDRGAALTNSSWVYEEPCAEHALAFMLALARQLPQIAAEQFRDRSWATPGHRLRSRLLVGQTAVLYGYGTIARRLAELLHPLRMNLIGVRRTVKGDEGIRMVPTAEADSVLPEADHVMNILPASPQTEGYFDDKRLSRMKPGAIFYNIGRGTTVDQTALQAALAGGRLAGAYLDVTDPEPLPPSHPLWTAPNCYITPHTAGGDATELDRLAEHFLNNLRRYESGEGMTDRVI